MPQFVLMDTSASIPPESAWLAAPQLPTYLVIQSQRPVSAPVKPDTMLIRFQGLALLLVQQFLRSSLTITQRVACFTARTLPSLTIRPDHAGLVARAHPSKPLQTTQPTCASPPAPANQITTPLTTHGNASFTARLLLACMLTTPPEAVSTSARRG